MQYLKVFALLVLVLAAMRVCSWALTWFLASVLHRPARISAVLSNAACFCIFAAMLYRDLMPGEAIDIPALLFGLTVFSLFTASDFYWLPWRRRQLS